MLAIIGGTGLYDLAGLDVAERIDGDTPFGTPSGEILRGRLHGHELLFLAHLLEQAALALAANLEAAAQVLAAARDFLAAHPQQWALLFAERVDQYAHTDYYRGFAYLLLGSLDALATLFADLATREAQT